MGVVQGLTEFLPISSTAHLRITPALLGWPDFGAAFTAVIQLGTLVAVLLYFRRELVTITVAALGAAGLFELKHALKAPGGHTSTSMIGIATLVSLVSGYAAIAWLLGYLRRHTMTAFVVYRVALGAVLLGLLAAGTLRPL